MKKILFFFFLITNCAFSQTKFSLTANWEQFNNLVTAVQRPDGNFIIAGYSFYDDDPNPGNTYMNIIKVDNNGNLIWKKRFATNEPNGNYSDLIANKIINTSDGGFAVLCSSYFENTFIFKFDTDGNLSWDKQYLVPFTSTSTGSFLQTSDNGYIFTFSVTVSYDTSEACVVKVNATGGVEWSKRYFDRSFSALGNYDAGTIEQAPDNNYVFLMHHYADHFAYYNTDSSYLVKIDKTGNVLWADYISTATRNIGYYILPVSTGGYLITAYVFSGNTFGDALPFILKTDENGAKVWSEYTSSTALRGFVELNNGDFVTQDYKSFLKINNSGELQALKSISTNLYFNSIIKTTDGGYLCSGQTGSEDGGSVAKFDANFNFCTPATDILGTLLNFNVITKPVVLTTDTNQVIADEKNIFVSEVGTITNACSVLAVKLIAFNAALKNESVELNWKISQDLNTSRYIVEKSIDGRIFNAVTQVMASGGNNRISDYTASDAHPSLGTNWYRLKIIDNSGSFFYSDIVAINNAVINTFAISPNPAQNELNIRIQALNSLKTIVQLVSINGKILAQKNYIASGSVSFDIKNFAKGVYFVKIIQENNIQVLKWVKG